MQEEVQAYVDNIVQHLPALDERLIQIRDHQRKDPTLCSWRDQILGEGKRRNSKINNYADLSVKDGLLLKDNRIVIPNRKFYSNSTWVIRES